MELGKADEAKGHLSEALRIDPADAAPPCKLAEVLFSEGKPDEAAVHVRRVIERQPDHVPALLMLAQIQATSENPPLRDPEEAIAGATRACNLTHYEDPTALVTLSGTFYEAGRFVDAAQAAERALQIAHRTGNKRLANRIQQHMDSCIGVSLQLRRPRLPDSTK